MSKHPSILSSVCSIFLTLLFPISNFARDRPGAEPPKVVVQADGTVEVPAQSVPMSSFLSREAKAYVTQHLKDMQNPELLKQVDGIPRFMKTYIERQRVLYPVHR